jgi:exodeoxyribonuclease VII large subunit
LKRKEEIVRNEFKNFTQQQIRLLEKRAREVSGTLRKNAISNHDKLTRKITKSENLIRIKLSDSRHFLELLFQKALLTDPDKILARGYSITIYNGKALKDIDLVNPTALIKTRLYNGHIISEVKETNKEI